MKSYTKYFPLIIFGILTLCFLMQRVPTADEANAWMIARSFNLSDIFFNIGKFEGHTCLWYFCLFPFAKTNFFYPYSMFILNWLFCLFALFILWKKAPFTNFEKTLITFSYPMFWYYAQAARCYSIGLLFLFLLLSYWNERLKRPYLISILILLFANTSALAAIGALIFGALFTYDLIKEKKFKPFLILILGAILFLIQVFGASVETGDLYCSKFLIQCSKFFRFFEIINSPTDALNRAIAFISAYLILLFPIRFYKNKRVLIFLFGTFFLLFWLFLNKYSGGWWHYLFFYVYFLAAMWLSKLEEDEFEPFIKKCFQTLFVLFLGLMCVKTAIFKNDYHEFVYSSASFKNEVQNTVKKDDVVFLFDSFGDTSNGLLPYIPNNLAYDSFGNLRYSLEGCRNYLNKNSLNPDSILKAYDSTKRNIGISSEKLPSKIENEKAVVFFTPLDKEGNGIFYNIKIVKKA